jgi:glutaredoxin 3
LKSKNIEYEERNIAHGTWTVQQLQEAVPGARTVPQIFVDEKHIGGFQELKTLIDQQGSDNA